MAISPYLTTHVLHKVAKDHEEQFIKQQKSSKAHSTLTTASRAPQLPSKPLISSSNSTEAGMKLRKWRSNFQEVLDAIPHELQEADKQDPLIAKLSDFVKTLRVHWNTHRYLLYTSIPSVDDTRPTKRVIASGAARLFDVLGWFSLVTLNVKLLLQQL